MAVAAFQAIPRSLEISPLRKPQWEVILTPAATEFLATVARVFEPRRRDLLEERRRRQARLDAGVMPDFLPHTETVRKSLWTVAPAPPDVCDRRVEITGPADRRTILNAFHAGANVFVADLENACSPAWANILDGHLSLREAVRGELAYVSPEGKLCEMNRRPTTLMVQPRGWHRTEKHMQVDGKPISASIFDFGLHFFHNAAELVRQRTGPYFYLPKLENHAEACLWNDIFVFAQEYLRIPRGTIRATVPIETITAAFEMDEILYELRDHAAGLSCGRSDYIFSFIKAFRNHPEFILPDRSQLTMDRHFLNSYAELLIHTCHRRGTHAIAGLSAQLPVKSDPDLNKLAMHRVRKEKLREVAAGYDGTSVADPALVPIARDVFDQHMHGPNQISRMAHDVNVTAGDLLHIASGTITEGGLRWNIEVAIRYLDSWLRGSGCISVYNLVEDTATAEICRTQVWQWVKYGAKLDNGRPVTAELVEELIESQLRRIRMVNGVEQFHMGLYRRASAILQDLMTGPELPDFLTTAAYDQLD